MNIDVQILNKFKALKEYVNNKNLKWVFLRNNDNELYLNNYEYFNVLSDSYWVNIKDVM